MDLWFSLMSVNIWFVLSMVMNVVMVMMCLYWYEVTKLETDNANEWYSLYCQSWRQMREASKARHSLIQQCKYWARKARSK